MYEHATEPDAAISSSMDTNIPSALFSTVGNFFILLGETP